MVNLIRKDNLSKEELKQLDNYFFGKHTEELLFVDLKYIIKFFEETEKEYGVSLTKSDLPFSLHGLTIEYKIFFEEESIPTYKKLLEFISYFGVEDAGLAYILGDHYYYQNNKEEALKYYEMIFKNGFNLCNEGYFDSLCRYLELIDNVAEKLEDLLAYSSKADYDIEFINTYLLLINHLDKTDDFYLFRLNDAIEKTLPLVRKYQNQNSGDFEISDSDIERNFCELLSLKMEYYIIKKEYQKAFEVYNQLTVEIHKSGCLRYYHIRDLFYYQMIKDMSVMYPELKFFDDIHDATFKVIGHYSKLQENQEIVLENKGGLTFKFQVTVIYKENTVIICPILPIIGIGGGIFTTLSVIDGQIYLKNKL